jgi:UMF1 family MFS transporter
MSGRARAEGRATLLERLGLHRPELRAWALYDVANSAAVTSVITAIFPIYFARVAAADLAPAVATQRYALATTAGLWSWRRSRRSGRSPTCGR